MAEEQKQDQQESALEQSSVIVAVRVRPLVAKEKIESPQICVTPIPDQNLIIIGNDKQFTFDKVFPMQSSQIDVFESCAKNLVLQCFSGYNATVLAYGQTGSGKTYTMGSGQRYNILEEDLGIIPRVINMLFEEIERRKEKAEFLLKVSFIEIYCEELHDLLAPQKNQSEKVITIREDKGSIVLMGLHEQKVSNYEEMAQCLDKGSLHRSTSSTLMNMASSRSHAIFTVTIEQHLIDESAEDADQEYMTAKFHFVDLAGSERAKRTGASGATLQEGININKGLLCLGNVISALTEESKKNQHVPYRDSKLTRILQDSLGGNSKTCMIACVSPAAINFEETLNSIKYANRARHIKNKPIVNRDPNSALIIQLKQEVYSLKQEIRNYQRAMQAEGGDFQERLQMVKRGDAEAEQELQSLKLDKQQLDKRTAGLEQRLNDATIQYNQQEQEKFQLRKERDFHRMQLEAAVNLLKENGIEFEHSENNSLIQEYQETIGQLQAQLRDKEKDYTNLAAEHSNLLNQFEKEQQLLIMKTQELESLRRAQKNNFEQKQIPRPEIEDYGRVFAESILANIESREKAFEEEDEQSLETQEEEAEEIEDEEQEQRILSQKEKIKNIDLGIKEKEELLKDIENSFRDMQEKLVLDMQQQYYVQVEKLEQELLHAVQERDQAIEQMSKNPTQEKQNVAERYRQKVQQLELRLRESQKKDREQHQVAKLVDNQKTQIQKLNEQIQSAKRQKIQLSRKHREEIDQYNKWKAARQKEVIQIKKASYLKDRQIQKLEAENRKKDIIAKRKTQELAAIQRRQREMANRQKLSKSEQSKLVQLVKDFTSVCIRQKEAQQKMNQEQIERDELQLQMDNLQSQYAILVLEIEKNKVDLIAPDAEIDLRQLKATIESDKVKLQEINDQLDIIEAQIKYKDQLMAEYSKILTQSEMQGIRNKSLMVRNIRDAKNLITILFDEVMQKALDGKQLDMNLSQKQVQIEQLIEELQQAKADRDLALWQYSNELEEIKQSYADKVLVEVNQNSPQYYNHVVVPVEPEDQQQGKLMELERRDKEKNMKIDDLTKKLDLITQKYNKLRKQCFDLKEVTTQEEPKPRVSSNYTSLQNARELAKRRKQQEVEEQRSSTQPGELTGDVWKRLAKSGNNRKKQKDSPIIEEEGIPSQKVWENLDIIEAHNGNVCSIAAHENLLYTGSNRFFKVWSLDNMECISEIESHTSFIKAMVMWPEHSLILTGCNNEIAIWDTISLQSLLRLRGHCEEIKALYIKDNYLFSAGKSYDKGNALFLWDLRNSQTPVMEREKNQDFFALTSHDNVLYFGGRSHRVCRLNLQNLEPLPNFEPPHYDTVTAFAHYNNTLISASRDKNLRRWDYNERLKYNDAITAHSSWINALAQDFYQENVFSAGKDGKIKVWEGESNIKMVSELSGHNGSVNGLASIRSEAKTLASAGADRTVRIWRERVN